MNDRNGRLGLFLLLHEPVPEPVPDFFFGPAGVSGVLQRLKTKDQRIGLGLGLVKTMKRKAEVITCTART